MNDHEHTSEQGGWLSRLIHEEEASAAVEFIVLIPVYILLLTGLYMMGNLAMLRGALVQAARFGAWHPNKNLGTGDAFFGPYDGTFTGGTASPKDVTYDAQHVKLSAKEIKRMGSSTPGGGLAQKGAEKLALELLNNSGQVGDNKKAFRLYEVESSFQYQGVAIGSLTPKQAASSAVYLPQKHERKEFEDGKQHPVARWGGSSKFDPDNQEYQPLSPTYKDGTTYFDGSGSKLGIWDKKARIKGSWSSEFDFFKSKVK